MFAGRRRHRKRIGADDLLAAAPRRHRRSAVAGEKHRTPFLGAHARVIHASAEVVGHAHTDRPQAVRFRTLDRLARGEFGDDMTNAVMTVDHCNSAGIDHELGLGHRLHHAVLDTLEIPTQTQHAMGLMAPQIGLHQRIGNKTRVVLGHTGTGVDGGGKVDELFGVDAGCGGHVVFISLNRLQVNTIQFLTTHYTPASRAGRARLETGLLRGRLRRRRRCAILSMRAPLIPP